MVKGLIDIFEGDEDEAFTVAGDIFFWITDDDRKFLVKVQSKIKIGSLFGELVELRK